MPPSPRLVLASASAIRADMLGRAGLDFDRLAVRIDEGTIRASLQAEGASPRDQADALAEMKALRASALRPGSLCLGSDQILSLDGRIFGKAETPAAATAVLADLSGRTHRLHSAAVAVHDGRPVWRHVAEARITFHALDRQEIGDYVARFWDEIRHSVGCYRFEAEGVRLISHVEGDFHTILGLPLLPLLTWLRVRGEIAPS
jgi:septum formation protein